MKNSFSSYGLFFSCPFESEEPDCPLKKLRLLPIEERLTEFRKFSDIELLELEQHHKACALKKELLNNKKP